jgi:hypothetical protein
MLVRKTYVLTSNKKKRIKILSAYRSRGCEAVGNFASIQFTGRVRE